MKTKPNTRLKSKPPRPESERQAAARLSDELGVTIHRSTVRRLRARGIDTSDRGAVRHALAMQERQPRPQAALQPPVLFEDHEPLTTAQLDSRLASLEAGLLSAADYAMARKLRSQIAGYRELVRIQRERGSLVDRDQVKHEGYQVACLIKNALCRIPDQLLPNLIGLDYPAACEVAEEWTDSLLTELHSLTESHIDDLVAIMEARFPKP